MKRGFCIALAAALCPVIETSDAGEVVKKTYYNSKGEAVTGYVYEAGRTRRSYERRSNRIHLPYGYGYGYVGYGYPTRVYSASCAYRSPRVYHRRAYRGPVRVHSGRAPTVRSHRLGSSRLGAPAGLRRR